jgi:hypothetical protein
MDKNLYGLLYVQARKRLFHDLLDIIMALIYMYILIWWGSGFKIFGLFTNAPLKLVLFFSLIFIIKSNILSMTLY